MRVFRGKNINEVFDIAVLNLRDEYGWIKMDSRNGEVLMFCEPITTVYEFPNERVLFNPQRNCNPFFHFIEGLWMIDGRNDLETLTMFAKKMADFSDDGVLVNGAYGHRWREWFGRDQLEEAIGLLRQNPLDRRVVLQMWDASKDLASLSKDVPCNTQVFFKCRPLPHEENTYILDMTVTNRSNDLIWGAYGANAVHFSMLHEYVASMCGFILGTYYQVSNNAHVYQDVWQPLNHKLPHRIGIDEYAVPDMHPEPLVDKWESFDTELRIFFDWLHEGDLFGYKYKNSVFSRTAIPMVEAWWLYKEGLLGDAVGKANLIKAPDWRKACVEWIERKR